MSIVSYNNAMIQVLVLSAKVRINKGLWQSLGIGNMFMPTFGFKIHSVLNLRNKITGKFAILLISIFLHIKKLHRLILLQILRIISYVIGYGHLYSRITNVNTASTDS